MASGCTSRGVVPRMVHMERRVAPPHGCAGAEQERPERAEPDERNRAQLRTVRVVVIEEATASNRS